MAGFEPPTSGVRNDSPYNLASTTAHYLQQQIKFYIFGSRRSTQKEQPSILRRRRRRRRIKGWGDKWKLWKWRI